MQVFYEKSSPLWLSNTKEVQKYIKFFSMLHLLAKIIQRLDIPEAFAGDGAEGQGAEEIHEKDLWDAEFQPLLEGFQ